MKSEARRVPEEISKPPLPEGGLLPTLSQRAKTDPDAADALARRKAAEKAEEARLLTKVKAPTLSERAKRGDASAIAAVQARAERRGQIEEAERAIIQKAAEERILAEVLEENEDSVVKLKKEGEARQAWNARNVKMTSEKVEDVGDLKKRLAEIKSNKKFADTKGLRGDLAKIQARRKVAAEVSLSGGDKFDVKPANKHEVNKHVISRNLYQAAKALDNEAAANKASGIASGEIEARLPTEKESGVESGTIEARQPTAKEQEEAFRPGLKAWREEESRQARLKNGKDLVAIKAEAEAKRKPAPVAKVEKNKPTTTLEQARERVEKMPAENRIKAEGAPLVEKLKGLTTKESSDYVLRERAVGIQKALDEIAAKYLKKYLTQDVAHDVLMGEPIKGLFKGGQRRDQEKYKALYNNEVYQKWLKEKGKIGRKW